jgi:hypothetical protein
LISISRTVAAATTNTHDTTITTKLLANNLENRLREAVNYRK